MNGGIQGRVGLLAACLLALIPGCAGGDPDIVLQGRVFHSTLEAPSIDNVDAWPEISEPIEGAVVTLENEAHYLVSVRTDAEGWFELSIPSLAGTEHDSLTVNRAGYGGVQFTGVGADTSLLPFKRGENRVVVGLLPSYCPLPEPNKDNNN